MTWLGAHWVQCLEAWAAVVSVSQAVGEVATPGGKLWKVAHVVSALSPVDVMKVVRTVKGSGVIS